MSLTCTELAFKTKRTHTCEFLAEMELIIPRAEEEHGAAGQAIFAEQSAAGEPNMFASSTRMGGHRRRHGGRIRVRETEPVGKTARGFIKRLSTA